MTDRLSEDLKSLRIDRSKKTVDTGRKRWVLAALLVLLIVLVAGAVAFFPERAGLSSLGAKPREVEVATVVRQSGGSDQVVLTASGYIVPRRRLDLAPKVGGRVAEIYFEKGDSVRKGQVLVRLEDQDVQAQLAQARANREGAEARLSELLAGSRPQEVERARAALDQAEANLRTTEINLNRVKQLNRSGVFSRQALDEAQNNYDSAAAQLKSARENYDLVRIGPRREQIDLARAQLREAEAAVHLWQTQLENMVVRAPIDGTILDRLVEKGEMVTTMFLGGGRGARPGLGGMANLKELEVELDINEADIPRVRLGQECTVSPDSYPDRKYKGKVREIAPEANRQKATIQVKVSILDPDQYLRPETNAKVNFLESARELSAESRILVPKNAVVTTPAGPSVFVFKDGKAACRPVKIGRELWGQAEVVSGLSGGERIIVKGLEGIAEGERVTLKQP